MAPLFPAPADLHMFQSARRETPSAMPVGGAHLRRLHQSGRPAGTPIAGSRVQNVEQTPTSRETAILARPVVPVLRPRATPSTYPDHIRSASTRLVCAPLLLRHLHYERSQRNNAADAMIKPQTTTKTKQKTTKRKRTSPTPSVVMMPAPLDITAIPTIAAICAHRSIRSLYKILLS